MTTVEELTTYKVKMTEEASYQVERDQEEKGVTVFVAKGEKGDKGDPGTTNYADLTDKPKVNDVTLQGNKTFEDLGAEPLTNIDIERIINSIV